MNQFIFSCVVDQGYGAVQVYGILQAENGRDAREKLEKEVKTMGFLTIDDIGLHGVHSKDFQMEVTPPRSWKGGER